MNQRLEPKACSVAHRCEPEVWHTACIRPVMLTTQRPPRPSPSAVVNPAGTLLILNCANDHSILSYPKAILGNLTTQQLPVPCLKPCDSKFLISQANEANRNASTPPHFFRVRHACVTMNVLESVGSAHRDRGPTAGQPQPAPLNLKMCHTPAWRVVRVAHNV